MEIKKAIFVKSSSVVTECPKSDKPEYAFIGRSNVGKSSLINMLCKRNELARVSSNPGKTININHYLVNDAWFLVDLPGYGYAKRAKTLREQWSKSMVAYFTERENLQVVFVLIDSRIPPQQIDLEFLDMLGHYQIPFSIIFTKADKNKQSETTKNVQLFKNRMLENWEELPPTIITSSVKKTGREDLLNFIEENNHRFNKEFH
ncbi:MAG: ribosome biogenesis GTP-binding protein YihA/YsxC [Bacteroidota bacterium]|jgi:GTP-binding protein|nr:ribosome biogenesis GTP-binding protein YihA/YsxC [Sphingobacteriales bacterium]